jgi:hydrogenase nickel incorporation protein HypA/HybF
MHELSLCQAIAGTVVQHAGGHRVARVAVQVGHFRQVVPDTLQFCWKVVTDGGALEGCEIDVDHVPAVVECNACGATTTLEVPILVCGPCGSRDTVLRSGDEFAVVSIDIEEDS